MDIKSKSNPLSVFSLGLVVGWMLGGFNASILVLILFLILAAIPYLDVITDVICKAVSAAESQIALSKLSDVHNEEPTEDNSGSRKRPERR